MHYLSCCHDIVSFVTDQIAKMLRWSMELEDVDFARGGVPDAGSLRKRKESKESQDFL